MQYKSSLVSQSAPCGPEFISSHSTKGSIDRSIAFPSFLYSKPNQKAKQASNLFPPAHTSVPHPHTPRCECEVLFSGSRTRGHSVLHRSPPLTHIPHTTQPPKKKTHATGVSPLDARHVPLSRLAHTSRRCS